MNERVVLDTPNDKTRSKRLKERTATTHDRLDKAIMNREPFASRERFGQFLRMQYLFHRDIDALYRAPVLAALLPDIEARRRFPLIAGDLADLGIDAPSPSEAPLFTPGVPVDMPAALGWLYVAEGSNLGAAFLLKEARKLDLSEEFGARHLAAAPEGRGLHWRTFTAALDSLSLQDSEEQSVVSGAEKAFLRVRNLVEDVFQ
ncbi:biliverdin-producing heme oxygenase [Nitratireductor pacificus]|uniref:Heme oxygenase-like protein n=1 Tax=Nitratireductor pacificus pht-3B TaxID=391937 RepID=K2MFM5_9HYPH|nr:biliverdin-producing heme oxygenase [Nitratireductor pacificus]EKF19515.1 Heme oxygenase-like protein [Nitratireductor pacificus pht-3B]